MISSGTPIPEKQATPIIPLKKDSNYRKKTPTDSSSTFLKKETSGMKILSYLPDLQSEENPYYPSSIVFESFKVSTENNHFYNVVSKLTNTNHYRVRTRERETPSDAVSRFARPIDNTNSGAPYRA